MKFTWGTGIFLVIVIFLLAVVAFFIYMSNLDINLVEDNYYEKELMYQQKIDKMKNAGALSEKVSIKAEQEAVVISFPKLFHPESCTGAILFYRPSDPAKDFSVPLQLNDSLLQVIGTGHLDPGKWTIKIDWTSEGTGYYVEQGIFLEQ